MAKGHSPSPMRLPARCLSKKVVRNAPQRRTTRLAKGTGAAEKLASDSPVTVITSLVVCTEALAYYVSACDETLPSSFLHAPSSPPSPPYR
ncbi:hypothetical protein OsJ_01539 [Oryza sativa Japonica Group]|uniref:Uncharacterized protein n=1 Tax=Oryza sativa subsp. japonica TaxID=39947 RepID=B9EW45_ORYSJ|nr:hypothetical protein OsJ_01539 [Oryza sativa Japonica Group]